MSHSCCRMMPTIGFFQMLMLASQICGRQTVSFIKYIALLSFIYISFPLCVPLIFLLSIQKTIVESLIPTLAGVEWGGVNMLHSEFGMSDVYTPRAQTPPSRISEVPSSDINSTRR